MSKKRKVLLWTGGILLLLFAAIYPIRYNLAQLVYTGRIGLLPQDEVTISPEARWVDDYFVVETIDERTFAISEPRYWQRNYSYLLIGDQRAVLFDSGTGTRQIRSVVEQLTSLPITVLNSHLHYDHMGNLSEFSTIAMIDLPETRANIGEDGLFSPDVDQFAGWAEGIDEPAFSVSRWLSPNALLDLGGRVLTVLHTPGHTRTSVSIWDAQANILLVGDLIYVGELVALAPDGALPQYQASAESLGQLANNETKVLGAHSHDFRIPVTGKTDLVALCDALADFIPNAQLDKRFTFKTIEVGERVVLRYIYL